ncbi:MAG TPA: Gfo/Idh/MocA family oxidoreductase [Tangfeifania sp.]|nr:Gfo/Idh/MocA family oxidoreductase [Tangfeifania sp.]
MKQKIKTALASFGMSGQVFHGPLLKVNPGFEVVQVFERSKNLSKKLFPGAEIVRKFDEILRNPEVELIVVNTPDWLHYEMAKQAINAGKHIVVEKPVTLRSDEATELLELARKKGVLFTVFQNRRWDNDFLTVKKVMESGNLGRLIEFESHFDRYRTFIKPNTWKEEGDEYAGVLHNLGSHMVDQAYVLFGMPKAVNAHLKIVRRGGKVADYYDIRMEYEGFSAILKCSYLVKNPGPRYSIFGEYGTFHKWGIDNQEDNLKAGKLPDEEDWGTEPEKEWGTLVYEKDGLEFSGKVQTIAGNYNAFYSNVSDALRKGTGLAVKPEETIDVLKILEACLESNRKRKTIELD